MTLAARDIFSTIKSQKYGPGFKVYVSFYEIYCGQLFDLINKRKRYVRQAGGTPYFSAIALTAVVSFCVIPFQVFYFNYAKMRHFLSLENTTNVSTPGLITLLRRDIM